ncbi:MAG: DUF4743 domain-containing protein [Rhodospirillales bacterium]|nr:DUF4743 domain-containing protein [Rhodospirillales bacterium]
MSFADRLAGVAPPVGAQYRPFRVEGVEVGLVKHDFAARLREFSGVFQVSEQAVDLVPTLRDPAARTRAVDGALGRLRERGLISGWRGEHYPVAISFSSPALFTMERAAIPLFGVRAYGVHMNGYVRAGNRLKMWIGKRSLKKPTAPGKLDQLVAGGQPAGLSLTENLVKECKEEADIPEALARRAVPVGGISYCTERSEGLRNDVLFLYDLEVPPDFEPRNTDGEIDSFHLWPIERAIEIVRDTDDFKFNCGLIVIDFLIRWGYLEPEHPDYIPLLKGLHG